MSILKDLRPFPPAAFFEMCLSIPRGNDKAPFKKRGRVLPSLQCLTAEKEDILLALAWTPKGLFAQLTVHLPLEEGDILECFIDTRDVKTSHVITSFCHHFLFDPMRKEGKEVTRFRGEDRHALADPALLSIKVALNPSGYQLDISMPKEVLYGYDPLEFNRIGFTYRFQKKNGQKRDFYLSSHLFSIEKHPSLWSSVTLSKESA